MGIIKQCKLKLYWMLCLFVCIFPDINYFHCLHIVEILKETEAASKNIFGRYSSQRMKDWQEIVKLYQQDGVFLGRQHFQFRQFSLIILLCFYEI